mgnify:CR=1 FL=1
MPGGVGLQRVVECEKYCRSAYFSLLIGCFYEGKNHKETMKLPFWIVVERNKGKGGWGLPKPLRRRGCAWRVGLGTVVCGRKAIKILIEKGRRISLYGAKTLP